MKNYPNYLVPLNIAKDSETIKKIKIKNGKN